MQLLAVAGARPTCQDAGLAVDDARQNGVELGLGQAVHAHRVAQKAVEVRSRRVRDNCESDWNIERDHVLADAASPQHKHAISPGIFACCRSGYTLTTSAFRHRTWEPDLWRLKLMLRGFMLTLLTRCPARQQLLQALQLPTGC